MTAEIARVEAAPDVLLAELIAIDTSPHARALKNGLLNDCVRAAIVDTIALLGERLRRQIGNDSLDQLAEDIAKGPHYHRRLGILVDVWRAA